MDEVTSRSRTRSESEQVAFSEHAVVLNCVHPDTNVDDLKQLLRRAWISSGIRLLHFNIKHDAMRPECGLNPQGLRDSRLRASSSKLMGFTTTASGASAGSKTRSILPVITTNLMPELMRRMARMTSRPFISGMM